MRRIMIFFLILALVLPAAMRLTIVAGFMLNRQYIIEHWCENKNMKELHCDGRCFLKKELKKEKHDTLLFAFLKEKSEFIYPHGKSFTQTVTDNINPHHEVIFIPDILCAFVMGVFHPPTPAAVYISFS